MRKKKEFFAPDMTPLIDVVFLLLIFFLVTSVFKKEDVALLLSLPTSKEASVKVKVKDISIYVSKKKMAYEKSIVTLTRLDEKLLAISNKQSLINVNIDKEVKYERIVKVLDLLKKHKLSNIALVNKQ